MTSRMQVAAELADRLKSGRHDAVTAAAAWLVERGRARDGRYLARDVAGILAARGYLLVEITSAHRLEESALRKVEHFVKEQTGVRELEVVQYVDKSLIGGVKIETPSAILDGSVRTKMEKMLEGVIN
jgi:F0F1-type ATP synthase delta subunit